MERINFDALQFLVKENKDKRVLLTFHSIGDNDSVSSAVALSGFFTNARVATPDSMTANSVRVLKLFGFEPEKIKPVFDPSADLVIMLDVNNFEDCGPFRFRLEEFTGKVLIIDHHAPKEIKKDRVYVYNDESYNSAASIVYALMKSMGIPIAQEAAKLLLTGILSDSAELKNATPDTFIQIGELLKVAKMDYPSLQEAMIHIADPQARAKTMEDVINANRVIMGNILYVSGKAHSHANLAADAAIKIGADISLFYSEDEKEISISARLRPPLDKQYGIHLGNIMKSLAPLINGNGGGHPGAAGAYGPKGIDFSEFEERFLQEINKRMGGRA